MHAAKLQRQKRFDYYGIPKQGLPNIDEIEFDPGNDYLIRVGDHFVVDTAAFHVDWDAEYLYKTEEGKHELQLWIKEGKRAPDGYQFDIPVKEAAPPYDEGSVLPTDATTFFNQNTQCMNTDDKIEVGQPPSPRDVFRGAIPRLPKWCAEDKQRKNLIKQFE